MDGDIIKTEDMELDEETVVDIDIENETETADKPVERVYNFAWNKADINNLSDISMSSVHTSDLSSFDGGLSDASDGTFVSGRSSSRAGSSASGRKRVRTEEDKGDAQEEEGRTPSSSSGCWSFF